MRKKALDLQKLNPNWTLAKNHGKAQNPGIQLKDQRLNSLILCPCCLCVIEKQPIPICENSKELFFLGYGFPLFYSTLQFCLMSVFILILIESGPLLYLSISDKNCDQYLLTESGRLLATAAVPYKCTNQLVKLSRTNDEVTVMEQLIRIFSFIAQMALLVYFRDSQNKLAAYHVQRNIRIKDFSVIFKNLPKIMGIKKKITDFFEAQFPEIHPQIQDIFLIPVIDEYYEQQREKEKITNKKRQIMASKKNTNQQLLKKIDSEIQHINQEMIKVCRQIDQKSNKDQLHAQKAIVVLKNEEQQVKVLQKFRKMDKQVMEKYFLWMGDQVTLKQAPDPKQIIWENVNFPKNQRWVKILLGWVLTILVLGGITSIFYALIRAKGERLDASLHGEEGYTDRQYQEAVAIVFVAIVGVQFFNKFLMKIILHYIVSLEMPQTTAQQQFSYALKYTLGMFFTTAVMTLAVEAIQFQNYFDQYGVVQQESIMFFFNAYFVAFLWISHPQYYIKKLQRWKNKGSENLTQKEANKLMEDYPYDIGKRYAEIIQTMWFTFLYSSLIPLGAFLTFSGFLIYYWIDKYNLLRRSSIQGKIESKLPLNAIKLIEITIFWKPVGQLIFDLQLRNTVEPLTIVMLCLAVIYMFLPLNKILKLTFDEKFNIKTVSYDSVKQNFTDIYETVDPIRRQLALDKMRQTQQKFILFSNEQGEGSLPHQCIDIQLITKPVFNNESSKGNFQKARKQQTTQQILIP